MNSNSELKTRSKAKPDPILKSPRRPRPFPKERAAKQDLRNVPQIQKQRDLKNASKTQNPKTVKNSQLKPKNKKRNSRSRLARKLTKTQLLCLVINLQARRYQLRRPNIKNRSRRARKKKLNKWLRVLVGRSVCLKKHTPGKINPMRVDYKNTRLLKHFISFQGKIMNRKQNRVNAKKQRVLKRVIKTSRNAGLLPTMQGQKEG